MGGLGDAERELERPKAHDDGATRAQRAQGFLGALKPPRRRGAFLGRLDRCLDRQWALRGEAARCLGRLCHLSFGVSVGQGGRRGAQRRLSRRRLLQRPERLRRARRRLAVPAHAPRRRLAHLQSLISRATQTKELAGGLARGSSLVPPVAQPDCCRRCGAGQLSRIDDLLG